MCASAWRCLYGDGAQVEVVSRPGRGTKVRLMMPQVAAERWERPVIVKLISMAVNRRLVEWGAVDGGMAELVEMHFRGDAEARLR